MTAKEVLDKLDKRFTGDLETKVVITKALEKQIPKKPRVDENSWYCCPNCNETFSLTNVLNRHNQFCGNCGQAIDWR